MKKLPILLLIFSFTVPALTQDADNCKVQATTSPVILSGSAMLRSAPIIEIRSKSSVGEIYNNGIEAGGSGTGGFVTSPGGGPSGSDVRGRAEIFPPQCRRGFMESVRGRRILKVCEEKR